MGPEGAMWLAKYQPRYQRLDMSPRTRARKGS